MFDRYLDKSVTLTPTAIPEQGGTLGALEWALSSPQENRPIPLYVNALRQLRKASQGISGHRDEIQFSRTVQSRLSELSQELGLHGTHFQIVNDGDPLIAMKNRWTAKRLPNELKAALKELTGQACALLIAPDAQGMAPWFADRATDICLEKV
ncbi:MULTISPECIES: hypothetical protein [Pseudomonas]|uniref:hypothetical protein n=1 Tax=Pseudomonas TaxID=286 RepID=UPI000CD536C3|nr:MULTISPECIES: hypothetical protein [Pseudomonas]RBH52947.1 hypothetical protein C3F00_029990 [Pseudomonas sp. MWU13-2860]